MIVTQQTLAECFGITRRRVQQLQTEGIIHRDVEQNGYDLAECNRAYLDYKITSETGRHKAANKEEVQAEHEKVKMNISKEKLRRIRRESLDVNAVEASWADMLIYFRSKLEALPAKAAMETAGKDTNDTITVLDGMVKDLIRELAAWDPNDIGEEENDFNYDEEDDEEAEY